MPSKDKKTIAIVLYPGMTALDLVGTLETLMTLNLNTPYRTITVAERIAPIPTDTPLRLVPNRTYAAVPAPWGLIVPGGAAARTAPGDAALRRYVRSAGETAELVASIGTGSLILAAAGLLAGRTATTHWAAARQLEELGVRYVRQRWVEDGKFVTAAGVTAGIDMALYLAARLTDRETMRKVQLDLEYDPQPPFGGIDWEHLGVLPRAVRAGVSLLAPLMTRRPKRLTRQAGWGR
ncbi:MAG: DJ-1/PfpI family protein [Sphaerobacter sp.]|nr:DJ-1/PfpI family protein [Sphaerobacter sp.]